MGTNYYLRLKEKYLDDCPKIVRDLLNCADFEWHIGKGSYGWSFLFQEQEIAGEKIDSYSKWQKLMSKPEFGVWDEYERLVDVEDLEKHIEESQNKKRHEGYAFYYRSVDGYDFDVGDFS